MRLPLALQLTAWPSVAGLRPFPPCLARPDGMLRSSRHGELYVLLLFFFNFNDFCQTNYMKCSGPILPIF